MSTATAERLTERALELALCAATTGYPDEGILERLGPLLAQPSLAATVADTPLASLLASWGRDEACLDAARSAYLERFERAAGGNPLHETEYARSKLLAKPTVLADLGGFATAFGFESAGLDMLDHVAAQLELLGVLTLKEAVLTETGDSEGSEIVRDARGKLLKDHTAPLVRALSARADLRDDATFGPVFAFCAAVIDAECEALGVEAEVLRPATDGGEGDHMECGACVALPR